MEKRENGEMRERERETHTHTERQTNTQEMKRLIWKRAGKH